MLKVFLSYRHDDAAYVVAPVRDRIRKQFGRRSFFVEVDGIPVGADFRVDLTQAIAECDVVLAVIGKEWNPKVDSDSHRLDLADDWVRIEIETAFERKIPVIPLLVAGLIVDERLSKHWTTDSERTEVELTEHGL